MVSSKRVIFVTNAFSSLLTTRSSANWSQRCWRVALAGSLGLGLFAGSAIAQDAPAEDIPAAEAPLLSATDEVPPATISEQEAERLMQQADAALDARNYDRAIALLEQAFTAFNTRSNYYQQLSGVFAGVDNAIADEHRIAARDSAEERDRASYDLAIVYRAADRPEDAIAPLVQVVASQGPTRELGQKAYQQLKEIGFVTTAYPR